MDTTQVLQDTQGIIKSVGSLSTEKLIMALGILIAGIIIIRIILKVMDKTVEHFGIDKALAGFAHSALRIILTFVLVITLADQLGIPVTSLVALLSLFALAISLSVQSVLANVVSGVVILTAKPFAAGDYVETSSVAGTIETISLMYTKLVTPDNRLILVPNSDLSATRITNYSAKPLRRMDITLTVDYAYSNEAVTASLLRAAAAEKLVCSDKEHAPEALIDGYAETGVIYVLRVWTKNADYWPVHNGLLAGLRGALEKDGIRLACAARRVRVEQ